ncbi:MAG: hypothetical protein M1834_002897 [Cirrosporium novae-zelandiae]|nr:MAG: hypothetical protein M1834_002897 [Cirrosporium novae-zelandiae]
MSFHRILPNPAALPSTDMPGRSMTRSTTSLLHHKITPDSISTDNREPDNESRHSSLSKSSYRGGSERSLSQNSTRDCTQNIEETTLNIRTARKRAGPTIETDIHPSLPTSASGPLSGGSFGRSGELPSHVCLRQPDRKVPRPRNASVAAQNPGLSNPEISKIIGEKWRQQPPEVKNEWKILAEEEKLRHQQQYPDYRYQPRRHGRNNSVSTPSTNSSGLNSDGSDRCPKCGGRTMTTPSTPLSPYQASTTPLTGPGASHFFPLMGTPRGPPPRYNPQPPPPHGVAGLPQLASVRDSRDSRDPRAEHRDPRDIRDLRERIDIGTSVSQSPDPKRRRLNNSVSYASGYHTPTSGHSTPFPFQQVSRESYDRSQISRGSPTLMGPPPRPRGPSHDPSLTLAPLKIQVNQSSSSNQDSIKAMVMSIHYLNKIKVLKKISPPLPKPNPTSPTQDIRGTVVALEGNISGVEVVTRYLQEKLTPGDEFNVKLFEKPLESWPKEKKFETYLELIMKWHHTCKDIMKFITTIPGSDKAAPTEETDGTSTAAEEKPGRLSTRKLSNDQQVHSKSSEHCSPSLSSISPRTSQPPSKNSSPPRDTSNAPIPIALVPNYQLTTCDIFSSHMPINDSYSAIDHWQWMATLWRGCVGADVTVIVTEVEDNKEMERYGGGTGVEVRLADENERAVVVRKRKGQDVDERALRRVGFEVEEWVRNRGKG